MKCEECGKNEATFHSIKKINGVTTEKHLCSFCQKEHGSKVLKMSNMGDFFSSFTSLINDDIDSSQLCCPNCGTTDSEFLNTGFVGCPDCYEALRPVMLPVVQKMQNDVRHIGKTPIGDKSDIESEYERLKRERDKAIELENYEQATILRDRMRQLKGNENN